MVDLLFSERAPCVTDVVLDPGCGTGEFIDGVIRWCKMHHRSLPRIVGVEQDPRHLGVLREKYSLLGAVKIEHADFLARRSDHFDFIVGNPPYVAITSLSEREKSQYRRYYATARGRFDLYLLFFEQALRCLAPGGRLAFITPEKYLYVETARPLRAMMSRVHIEEIRFANEDTFTDLVTYPTITMLRNAPPGTSRVLRRDGRVKTIQLPRDERSWLPMIEGAASDPFLPTLADVCTRISCGVATGADSVFVWPATGLDPALRRFAHPTIAGRQLTSANGHLPRRSFMLMPYDNNARLLSWGDMGPLGNYLRRESVKQKLSARTCVQRKPWYAFHETPFLSEILRPKILCKDICEQPRFWIDRSGEFVPRHSVYYLVPKDPAIIDLLADYLNSPPAHLWLSQNCQRAAKGYLRLQSRVLQRMPLSGEVAEACSHFSSGPAGRQPLLAYTG
jgi:SAM-dependent methyltransferase